MQLVSLNALRDEQASYNLLLEWLHPDGLHCPQGHPLPRDQAPHDRHRAPVLDYRCRECGTVYNIFTNTPWSGSRYSCPKIVQLLCGIAQGESNRRLAERLKVDRSNLIERRRKIQPGDLQAFHLEADIGLS